MVRAAPDDDIQAEANVRPEKIGKASGGFTVALFVSAPLLMVATFLFGTLLMGAAQGAQGLAWLGGTAMFGSMAVVWAAALFLAESSTD